MSDEIFILEIDPYAGQVVGASATGNAYTVDLGLYRMDGQMSLQIAITGTGTARVYYISSNDGTTYVSAEGATDIISSMTAGTTIAPFSPAFSKKMKIYVQEIGGANSITITKAVLAIK